jgi:hypothetical protein
MTLFNRKTNKVTEIKVIPMKFPEMPGIPQDQQLKGIVLRLGSHWVNIQSDSEDLLKQVVRKLDNETIEWKEHAKFMVGED